MEELILNDRGGVPIKQDELIADKLMTYIEGLNPVLGTEKDPKLSDLQEFMNDIKKTAIIRIDPESISSGRFDDVDLVEGSGAEIVDVTDETFKSTLWDEILGNVDPKKSVIGETSILESFVTPFVTEAMSSPEDMAKRFISNHQQLKAIGEEYAVSQVSKDAVLLGMMDLFKSI